ncbi:MAG: hypothetical protein AAGA23_07130 [Pseudomonadota bacterium]
MTHLRILLAALIALLSCGPAAAYIGPGAGISFLGSIGGIIITILVALGAILLWPIRRMMKRRKAATGDASAAADPSASDSAGDNPPSSPAP